MATNSTIYDTNHTISSAEHIDACVICLDTISAKAKARPCNHASFDFLCLVSWLQQRPNCPLCNASVISVIYNSSGGNESLNYKEHFLPTTAVSQQKPAQSQRHARLSHARRRRICSPPPTVNEALQKRRLIYERHIYSLHVGSNHISRFRDLTPELFANDASLISRARKWIRRELQVFKFLDPSHSGSSRLANDGYRDLRANNAEFLLEYIVAILKTVDLQDAAGRAEDMISEFLGRDHTQLFIHELRSWLRSPYAGLLEWDRSVQYPTTYRTTGSMKAHEMPVEVLDNTSTRARSNFTPNHGGRYIARHSREKG